jgi:two-component system phosphate regulon sensor histidine kinase PhoR
MSFRLKTVFVIAFVVLLALGFLYVSGGEILRNEFLKEAELRLNRQIEGLVLTIDPRSPNLEKDISTLADAADLRITVVSPSGIIVADSDLSQEDRNILGSISGRPEIRQATESGKGISQRYSVSQSSEVLFVALRAETGYIVRIGNSVEPIEMAVSGFRREFFLFGLIALTFGVCLAWLLSWRITSAVPTLSRAAQEITRGTFVSEIPVDTRDEIGKLARQMEEMSVRLRDQIRNLESEKDHLTTILDSMTEGVLVTDSRGIVIATNPAFLVIFDLNQEPLGRMVIEAVRKLEVSKGVESVLSTTGSIELEFGVNGKRILARFAPVGESHPLGVVVVFHDITEQRRLEGLQKEFISNVSHELKTPLTSIKGYAETLLEEKNFEGVHRTFVEKIFRNSEQLGEMIEDLFSLARLESSQKQLQLEEVNFEELIGTLRVDFSDQLKAKHLSFQIENKTKRDSFTASKRYISRVFKNLIENAIKYTERGGITLRMDQKEDEFIFSVIDTGKGIPEEDLDRIFERFYRVEKDRSRKSGGTGIGLAIVKHIVQIHHGRVWAVSELGKGSSLHFTLPINS